VIRRWEDLNARAAGLRTHLLDRTQLHTLAESPDIATLADGLRGSGFPLEPTAAAEPATLELAVRRWAAAQLAILARWGGPRTAALAVVYEDEERRSLRALVRGAVAGAEPPHRIAGAIPTPSLPERALAELARQAAPGAIAALLVAWRHPYGAPLRDALGGRAGAREPDLLRLELALNHCFAARAPRLAGRAGALADYVRETLDLENALAALVLAGREDDLTPRDAFLAGGRLVTIAAFEEAVATGGPARAAARLATALRGSPLAAPLSAAPSDPTGVEDAALRARILAWHQAARRNPLGPAPVLAYALQLRAQTVDLRRAIWGVALGAPAVMIAAELVTPA
jgi:vacuolar-type H+-ATPase subunit C/Vma6